MFSKKQYTYILTACLILTFQACKAPSVIEAKLNKTIPKTYATGTVDTTNSATMNWRTYFTDPYLQTLIDTALNKNQELLITFQEIQISRNEVRAKKGKYLPEVNIGAAGGINKVSRYTNIGALEKNVEIEPGKETPEPLQDYLVGLDASWEVDIWKKLRNAKKAAVARYLSSIEGKNFIVTNLISEIARSYYELLALDNQLNILDRNIAIQSNALNIVKIQKDAAKANELAVRRFEAEVLKTKGLRYAILQRITETENRINFLAGRYPQHIERSSEKFVDAELINAKAGIPVQLLSNRPDIKQAELALKAAKLDVKSAKAAFYPSLRITGGVGVQAYNAVYLIKKPESLIFSLVGDLAAPLINRNEIKAKYLNANAKQQQAIYSYEQTILKAYNEVANQLSKINNLNNSYEIKTQQVGALTESINISVKLFKSARADYMEVLLTQRDAVEAKFEMVELKMQQMNAMVNIYQSLGGGWSQ
ncbi:MAG: TolC family protein [Flavipsychrobacter sp.]